MKLAVSVSSEGSISPLFDASKGVWIVDLSAGVYGEGRMLEVASSDSESKVKILSAEKVELLLCGAISRCLEAYARSYGIEVEPFLCGPMKEILWELANGRDIKQEHRMPGCPGRMGLNTGCRRRAGRCAGRNNQNKKEA